MIEANRPSPPRRGLQFSLRTALLALVLVAVAMTLWISYRQSHENQRLRAENTRLRNETGQLTIEPGEENKVHAIKLTTLESYTWRWCAYVPDGRPITLRHHRKRIRRQQASGLWGDLGSPVAWGNSNYLGAASLIKRSMGMDHSANRWCGFKREP